MAGWVKLHRDIESWEWVDDAFVYWVFTRMVLMANFEPRRWQGIEIPRGSFVTSYANLALKFKCGVQKIRTALDKLKLTHEITIKTTTNYSIISIVNYDRYNDDNIQNNNQITNEQQTDNKRLTTTKELKNLKNKRNNNTAASDDALRVVALMNDILGRSFKASPATLKHINARLNEKYGLNDFEAVLRHKHGEWSKNADMAKFLRPETLFGNKFEGYLQAAQHKPKGLQDELLDFFQSAGVSPVTSEEIMNKSTLASGDAP